MEEINQVIKGLETLKKYICDVVPSPVSTYGGLIVVNIIKRVGAVDEYWLGEWGWSSNKEGDEWEW